EAKRSRARARLEEYRTEAGEAYPEVGAELSEIALRIGGGRLLYDYPFYEHLVRRSALTVVHTESAREEILSRCASFPAGRVRRIRMGTPRPPIVPRDEARRRLGLPAGALLLASFGLVTPEKRISTVLRALARLKAAGVRATYLLVGGAVPHYDPLAEARKLGVAEEVCLVGRVPEDEFRLHAFASDLCLNLRYPSAGETSATLLTLLACGRPVLLTDQVHVRDFPDAVVARSPLEGEADGLYCDLMDLIRCERRRRELGEAARRYAETEASPEAMAADYLALFEAEATL
ncbi:MAG TPA: glycosyltransferase, partial [Vicinamibacteria bacterium]